MRGKLMDQLRNIILHEPNQCSECDEITRLTKQRGDLVFVLNQLTKIKFLCNTYADKQRSKTHMDLIKEALASVKEK